MTSTDDRDRSIGYDVWRASMSISLFPAIEEFDLIMGLWFVRKGGS